MKVCQVEKGLLRENMAWHMPLNAIHKRKFAKSFPHKLNRTVAVPCGNANLQTHYDPHLKTSKRSIQARCQS